MERVLSSERAHKQVLTVKKEHAHHFEQQHRNTCHSGLFQRARLWLIGWRIPLWEYVLASETCSHSS